MTFLVLKYGILLTYTWPILATPKIIDPILRKQLREDLRILDIYLFTKPHY